MYVLENSHESDRLELQSKMQQYAIANEIKDITFPQEGLVLDAGCGTGLLANYVKQLFPNLKVEGCDRSNERIQFADRNYSNIHFYEADLTNFSSDKTYELILNRYVAHHMGEDLYLKALTNFYHHLSPSGRLGIIDIENNIIGLGTMNKWLEEKLDLINKKFYGNLLMGRKIPSMLHHCGFKNIDYSVTAMTFKGEELKKEKMQIKWRLEFSKNFLIDLIGESDYERFVDNYMQALEHEIFFYNKFIITAEK